MKAVPSLRVGRRALFAAAVALILPGTLQPAPPDESNWSLLRPQLRDEGPIADQKFWRGFEVPAGPRWLLSILPGSSSAPSRARTAISVFDSAGDPIESAGPSAEPMRDTFDLRVFHDTVFFPSARIFSAPLPNALTDIKQFDGTSGSWAVSGNWAPDGVPTDTDDVLFDNEFVATLPNIHLGGGSRVANSIALALTTNQNWSLGAAVSGTTSFSATLTLTTGLIKRSNTTNDQTNIIGATSGGGLQGVTTLATTATGFTITNQSSNGILEIDAVISGSTKTVDSNGVGTVVFGGANTYTGATTVSHGTLLIFGDQSAATGAVSVKNVGTVLGGIGTIGGAVTVSDGANITPGTNGIVGTLTLNSSLTFSATNATIGTYLVDLAGSGSSDKLVIGGILDLSGSLDHLTLNNTPDGSSSYTLATYGSVLGVFDMTNVPANYQLIYGDTSLVLAPVPEPGTWIGAALALGAIGFMARGRARKTEILKH